MFSSARRSDLDELSIAILTSLANTGLVKRAQREHEQGKVAPPEIGPDLTIVVRCDDGAVVTFAPGSGFDGTCSCGAAGVCRHRIAAVLSYQATAAPIGSTTQPTTQPAADSTTDSTSAVGASGTSTSSAPDPGGVDQSPDQPEAAPGVDPRLPNVSDVALHAHVPARTLSRAAALRTRGYVATVHLGSPDDDEPCLVELGTATVRFLLGSDLRYARCDCNVRTACEHVALAVWAIDEARDRVEPNRDSAIVAVGSPSVTGTTVDAGGHTAGATADDGGAGPLGEHDALVVIRRLVELVLLEGLSDVGPGLLLRVRAARRLAERASYGWLVVLLDELEAAQAAHEARAGGNVREHTARVVAGLLARSLASATASPTALPRAMVLGTGERSDAALRQIRLTGAGASVRPGDATSTVVEVALVEPASSTMLIARRSFAGRTPDPNALSTVGTAVTTEPEVVRFTGPELATRAITKGVPVLTLATGSVVSNAVTRRPNRVAAFTTGGLRRTAAVAGNASVDRFEDSGMLTNPDELIELRQHRPPQLLRPLLATEDLVALRISGVEHAWFDAGAQECTVAATCAGSVALVRATYRDLAPNAPAALSSCIEPWRSHGGFVVGRSIIRAGTVIVEPMLLGSDRLVVPDLATDDPKDRSSLAALPAMSSPGSSGPFDAAFHEAWTLLCDLAVDGISRVDRRAACRALAQELRRLGLAGIAGSLDRLAALGWSAGRSEADLAARIVDAWADAAFAVLAGLELADR